MNALLKYYLIISTFFIIQFSFGQKPAIGIKAGLALSNATINQTDMAPNYKYSPGTGIIGGIYLNAPSGKNVIFRPGVEIVSKGVKQKYDDPYNNNYFNEYPIKFTFIDFPINILYKINFPNGHLIAGGGPVIGIPIIDQYSQYPLKTEFSINGIVGYEIPIGFSLNVNYAYGLSNASGDKQNTSKISNRYLGITVGYTF